MKRLKQVARNILSVFIIKVFTVILILVFAVLAVIWLTGCAPAEGIPATETPAIASPSPSPSPTPLPSIVGTATPRQVLPTPVPTMTPWAFSTPSQDFEYQWPYGIPAMAIPIESTFDGPVKVYVLLGSDWMKHRNNQDATDAIMLVLVDTESDAAMLVSIPRDLYVFIPGFGMGRINRAWSIGQFDAVRETVRYNFGLEVDGVVYARIYAIESFIDNGLGNLFVQVREPIFEKCGDLVINLVPGEVFMDGEYAMCYARSRMMSSDYSRMSRQQEILAAMKKRFFERAMDHPVGLAEDLYEAFVYAGIKTDISILDIPGLVAMAMDVEDSVDFALITPPLVEHFDHPETGAWLLQMPTPDVIYDFFRILLEQ